MKSPSRGPMTYSHSPRTRFVNFDTTGELLVDVDMDDFIHIHNGMAIILTQTARTSSVWIWIKPILSISTWMAE